MPNAFYFILFLFAELFKIQNISPGVQEMRLSCVWDPSEMQNASVPDTGKSWVCQVRNTGEMQIVSEMRIAGVQDTSEMQHTKPLLQHSKQQ